jgi:hypothetical protein
MTIASRELETANNSVAIAVSPEIITTDRDLAMRRVKSIEDEWLRYDPQVVASYYQSRPLKVLWRFLNVFFPILSFAAAIIWDQKTQRVSKNRAKRAVQLREI